MRRLMASRAGVTAVLATGTVVLAPARAEADVPGAGIIRDAIGGAAGFAFENIAGGIAGWVLGAVADLIHGVVGFLGSTSRPSLDAVWFSGPGSPFAVVRGIAFSLLLGFVLLAVIQGLLAGEPAAGAGRVARDVVLAVLGMVATVAVTVKLLDLTDALSQAVLGGAEDQALHFLTGFGAAAGIATGGFGVVLVGLIVAVAALLVWIELMIRAALIYLLVALTPLAFAAMTWPAARGVLRRTVELLLAVIASKFVICVAVAVGAAALGGAGNTAPAPVAVGAATGGAPVAASLGTLLSGAAILALAAFSPFVVLKLMPLAEAAVTAQGISRAPARGAQTGMSTYYYASTMRRLSGGGTHGGQGGGPSGAGAGRIGGQGAAAGSPTNGTSGTASASGGATGAAAGAGAANPARKAGERVGTSAEKATATPSPPPPSPRQQGTTAPRQPAKPPSRPEGSDTTGKGSAS